MRTRRLAVAILVSGACATGVSAPPAEALNPLKPVCAVGGLISGLVGKACTVVQHPGRVVSAGKQLASGHVGGAVKTFLGDSAGAAGSKATFALGLAAVVTWVLGGAKYVLHGTATIIGHTTSPQLRSTWFSATYWRVAGIAAVLTLPFLFAAAIQALLHSDLALLVRAALGYLPLAMLGVSIAAPLTMLLLTASDQLAAAVSSAASGAGAHFLDRASAFIGGVTIVSRSPFLAFLVGLLTVGGAITLWCELLARSAAVYVIVLMLPLAFAALVWPARRIWAVRAVELLVALILSKFMIVAVLSLGGAALSASSLTSLSGMIAGFVLLVMASFSPWVLLRVLPLGELAGGVTGSIRAEGVGAAVNRWSTAHGRALGAEEWATRSAEMRRQAEEAQGDYAEPVPDAPADQAAGNGSRADLSNRADLASDADSPAPPRDAGAATAPDPGRDSGVPSPDAQDGNHLRSGERSPGLGPIWQTDDFSWPLLTLGTEDGWPPPPLEHELASRGGSVSNGGTGRSAPEQDATRPDGARDEQPEGDAPSRDDHDPAPPRQPSDGGPL